MKTSTAVREEIEAALYAKVPGALSPQVRAERVRVPTGVAAVDAVTRGGFPVGAITEIVGPESSGRTTLTASFVARRAAEGMVFAWVDVTDALDPESMAAAGVDLERMLWVRCGGPGRTIGEDGGRDSKSGGSGGARGGADRVGAMVDRTVSAPSVGGGCGSPHPRSEGRGMSEAIGGLMSGVGLGESRPSTKSQPGGNRALVPAKRKDRWIGTPSAPNRVEGGSEPSLSWRATDRVEQVATDRLPARRGDGLVIRQAGGWEPRCAEAGRGRRPAAAVDSNVPVGANVCTKGGAEREGVLRFAQDGADQGKGVRRGTGDKARGGSGRGASGGTRQSGSEGAARPWSAIDQALRAADMLLQAGGFGVIVLDLGGVVAEAVWKIPMATWFRFRAAAERSQTSLVLLTQYACARSSAELVLEMEPGVMEASGRVMTGVSFGVKVGRQRFVTTEAAKVVAIRRREDRVTTSPDGQQVEDDAGEIGRRRPPQPERLGAWSGTASWAQASGMAEVRSEAGKRRLRGRSGRVG